MPSSLHLEIKAKSVIHNILCRYSKFLTPFSAELLLDYFKGKNPQTIKKKKQRLELAKPQISSLHLKVDFQNSLYS